MRTRRLNISILIQQRTRILSQCVLSAENKLLRIQRSLLIIAAVSMSCNTSTADTTIFATESNCLAARKISLNCLSSAGTKKSLHGSAVPRLKWQCAKNPWLKSANAQLEAANLVVEIALTERPTSITKSILSKSPLQQLNTQPPSMRDVVALVILNCSRAVMKDLALGIHTRVR